MIRPVHMIRRTTAIGALTLLTGCGIAAEHTAEPIQPPSGAALATTTQPPDAGDFGRAVEILYFVKDELVVQVTRHATTTPDTHEIVTDLLAGPSDTETAAGYTSALLGDSVVDTVEINTGHAVVALASPVADTARNDEVLAYAQLVCTLTALPQIRGVIFTNNGQPVAVPRGDGSLSPIIGGQPVPLTAADYIDLIGK